MPPLRDAVNCFCRHCQALARERGIDVRRALEGYQKALDWQTLWTDSQHQMYRDVYGVAKACKPDIQVGWHVYHIISFSPFYRADQDYAEMSRYSDFIKVVIYNNCAGPRFHLWVERIGRALFADATPTAIYPGIDIDIPTPHGTTTCTREGVKAVVLAAFAGGAQGVVLSRKYSEMRLDNLAGAGDAIKELAG